ncbi:WD40-repeat-containing domain protein [Podospora appendiculata]|uniref:WD40-repeat-containing domain protein n=1 Tax=Podospora appendiculata TaxID=314037 RepID=A0AAE0X6H7_9PEZI|nr:WD40-repeat-containing domain protein [Podospora appendiculata]
MATLLFERSTGNISPDVFSGLQTTKLLSSFRSAPRFRFDSGERFVAAGPSSASDPREPDDSSVTGGIPIWAHPAGVNALALERFDGRILVSGGADGAIKLWDLEQNPNPTPPHTYRAVASIPRAGPGSDSKAAAAGHRFGVTHLSFYPFDSAAFLSCSYDQTLKLWSTETARVSGSFDLGAKAYTHAISPIASHLLVACGTQHPAVRLVDLRSSAAVQSLVSPGQIGGSAGAALAVTWSPVHEHVLAAGSADGAVRIWDVRRANGLVGLLDQEDSLGPLHPSRVPLLGEAAAGGAGTGTDPGIQGLRDRGIRASARAHTGPANGLAWTDDGAYIISTGHDRRIRVWDAATGANTLANFGPTIRNSHVGSLTMFVSPLGLTPAKKELLFFPNETEILVMDLHEGSIVSRLRGMGPTVAAIEARGGGERNIKNRLTSIVWRGAGGGGSSSGPVMGGTNAVGGIYSGHMDGQIRAWLPQLEGLDEEDEDNTTQEETETRAKKRKALDNAFRSLMGRQITFT